MPQARTAGNDELNVKPMSALGCTCASVGFLAALLLLCEAVAWLIDARYDIRYRLHQSLESVTPYDEPIAGRAALPWPRNRLYLRLPEEHIDTSAVYRVGGTVVSNACVHNRKAFVRTEELARGALPRVFIVGGSAAFGYPYAYRDAMAGRLQDQLTNRYEVINAAQVFWSSGRLVPLVGRIVRECTPDTVVIYSGNNEWIHWVDDEQRWMSRELIDTYRLLANSRLQALLLFHAFERTAARQDEAREQVPGFRIHAEFEGYRYAIEHPKTNRMDAAAWRREKQHYLEVFRTNLLEMIGICTARRVRVVLLTVPFRHTLSPAWKHPQPLSLRSEDYAAVTGALHRADALMAAQKWQAALAELDAACARDPESAIGHYMRAVCLEQLLRPAEAEAAYASSREHMTGNLGSRLSINGIIREVARSTGVALSDAHALLVEQCHAQGRWSNRGMLADDCHPSLAGQQLMATHLAELLSTGPLRHAPGASRALRGTIFQGDSEDGK
jgi:hypothetical protein